MTKKKKERTKQSAREEDIVLETDVRQQPEDEIVFEEEDINDATVVKKLRERLKKCEEEKKENLDGWQRAQADMANVRKDAQTRIAQAQAFAKQSFAQDLLPALDSFDMAFKGEAWDKVDDVWKKGVEYIHTQFIQALEQNGITVFGEVGDVFDHTLHEATGEQAPNKKQKPNTIAEVLRKGYRTKDTVLRPAQVIIFSENESASD